MEKGIVYLKILTNFILFIVSLLFITLLLPKIIGFFLPFVIAWIVALIAEPLVRFLENKVKILRKHSSAIIIALVLMLITGAVYLIILIIFREVRALIDDLPQIIDYLEVQLNYAYDYLMSLSMKMPQSVQNIINNIINETNDVFGKIFENINIKSVLNAGSYAKSAIQGLLNIIITIIAAYFFLVNKDDMKETAINLVPQSVRDGWQIVVDNFKTAMGGYFKAQFKIMLVVALIILAGLLLLGVEYAILITILIAVLDFLPVLGAGGILWPWAIIDMISGHYTRAIGLVVIYIIVQIVRQMLQPKMVADSIGISPLATLVFMYVGYKFYGVIGMIFGIPVGMIITNLYKIGIFDNIIKGIVIIIQDINEFRKY